MTRKVLWRGILVVVITGCQSDQPVEPPAQVPDLREVQLALEEVGYFGPVGVASVARLVNGRVEATMRNLLLPAEGQAKVGAALRIKPAMAARLFGRISVTTAEVTDPDSLDLTNNSTIDRMQIYTPPSIVGRVSQDIRLLISSQFMDYNSSTGSWYIVPGGHVDSGYVTGRNNSAGHYHGSSIEERRLDRRVGRLERQSDDFTGSLAETWFVPEVAQEINTTYLIRMVGGPKDGQSIYFFSVRPYAVRVQGLKRITEDAAIYSRTGGNTIHPEDFNDWATQELVDSLRSAAAAYKAATNTIMRVNDAALMFGGKFDIGRRDTVNGQVIIVDCVDGSPGDCWGGVGNAHSEHRLGTEVDVNPQGGSTDPKKATFLRIMAQHFQVLREGNHLHLRVPGSVYYTN